MKQLVFSFMNEQNTVGLKEYSDAELLTEIINRKVMAEILNATNPTVKLLELANDRSGVISHG